MLWTMTAELARQRQAALRDEARGLRQGRLARWRRSQARRHHATATVAATTPPPAPPPSAAPERATTQLVSTTPRAADMVRQ
jgi:hypothetical protein